MVSADEKLIDDVATYYTSKIEQYGITPRGVDWNGEESQVLRFQQLCKIIDTVQDCFSINDLGCGYGALYDYMVNKYDDFTYTGVDISSAMINAASKKFSNQSNANFVVSNKPDKLADYCVASGIFNVRLKHDNAEWLSYIESSLDVLNEASRYGFSFNCLTEYSDKDKMRDYLYYANPCKLFDYCKKKYSNNVALLHDYDLYEFTILVRKVP